MRMLSSPDSNRVCDPICVNVGGEIYTTTLDTLTRCRESMLGAMFSGQIPLLHDKHGNVFIDRDGKVFRYILNYLRCNSLDLPQDYAELALLRREADFFQIRPLLEELKRREAEPPKGRPSGALLCVDVDSLVRVLHFNFKCGPENYELRSCTVHVYTAHVFCTSHVLLQRLCSTFSYHTCDSTPLQPSQSGPTRLRLEWVPCPVELPREQHSRQGYRELSAIQHCDRNGFIPITDTSSFIAEMLRVVLEEGFHIDLVSPDPADLLNCQRLRCVRY